MRMSSNVIVSLETDLLSYSEGRVFQMILELPLAELISLRYQDQQACR